MINAIIKKILIVFSLIAFLYSGYMVYQRKTVEAASMALVQDAKKKADQAVESRALEFKAFIDSNMTGAKLFSEDVIGLSGTLQAARCALPWTENDCYKKYIADKFSEHIFTPDGFMNAMKRSITGGVQDIEGIENQLAVSLRQVILGRSLAPSELPLVEAEFKNTIEAARIASNDAVLKETGGLVAQEVVTQIAAEVLIGIGVSGGILTTAGANSWWTFGGSLVIGLLANALWNYYTQPAQGIEKAVVVELNKMSASGSATIRDELTKKVAGRSQLWETTVKEAF